MDWPIILWQLYGILLDFSFISSYCRSTESALSSACFQAGCPSRCTGLCLFFSPQNGKAAVQRHDLQLHKMLREISMPYLKTFCLAAKECWSVVWGCAYEMALICCTSPESAPCARQHLRTEPIYFTVITQEPSYSLFSIWGILFL